MLKVFEAFAGYGSQSIALRNIGVPFEVVAISEIDKYALKAYKSIHGDVKNLGDISKIKVEDIPDHDLFTYSFPCQDISVAGKQEGIVKGETRSGLLYECEKVIETKKPKYLLLENVKNLVGKKHKSHFDKWLEYLEGLGYTNYWKVLNAKDYGVPQNRERVFVVSILGEHKPYEFPSGIKLEKRLKDFLEDSVENKYYLSEEIQKRFKQTKPNDGINNIIGTTAPEFRTIGQRDLVYSQEGTMGALVATDYKQPKQIVEIPQATKKGYAELEIPGIADLSFPNSKTRRGRVQEGGTVSPTIMANNQELCVFEEVKNGAIRGKYNEDGKIEQQLELKSDGIINTITGVQKDNVVVESKIIEHNTICEQHCDEGLRFFKGGVCGTIRAINSGGDKRIIETTPQFRIRKLTPKECFRLMGMSDTDIDKIQATGISNSQQYKMAGNSIVVDVLEGIFRELFLSNNNQYNTEKVILGKEEVE